MSEVGYQDAGAEAVEVDLEVGREIAVVVELQDAVGTRRHHPDLADAAEGGCAPEHEILVTSEITVGVEQIDVQLVAFAAREVTDNIAVCRPDSCIAIIEIEAVSTTAAGQGIGASVAEDHVVAVSTLTEVLAGAAEDTVAADTAIDVVGTAAAQHRTVAKPPMRVSLPASPRTSSLPSAPST